MGGKTSNDVESGGRESKEREDQEIEREEKQGETINTSILVQAASSSTQLSVFAVLEALQESKPCRQATICHPGCRPTLLCGAKMAANHTHSDELYLKLDRQKRHVLL